MTQSLEHARHELRAYLGADWDAIAKYAWQKDCSPEQKTKQAIQSQDECV